VRAPAHSLPQPLTCGRQVHSGSQFAARHLREDTGAGPTLDDEAAVKQEMTAEFLRLLRQGAYANLEADHVVYSSVMVWDHATPVASPESAMQCTHLLDQERLAGVCGDFFAAVGGEGDGGDGARVTGVEAAALRCSLPRSCMPALSPALRCRIPLFWLPVPPQSTAMLPHTLPPFTMITSLKHSHTACGTGLGGNTVQRRWRRRWRRRYRRCCARAQSHPPTVAPVAQSSSSASSAQ